jgi:hypothetical protein
MVEIGSLHIDSISYKMVIAHFSDAWDNGIRYMWIEFSKDSITLCKNYY